MILNRRLMQHLKTTRKPSKSIVGVVTTLLYVISLFIHIVTTHFPIWLISIQLPIKTHSHFNALCHGSEAGYANRNTHA
jgi:hypothetical protein